MSSYMPQFTHPFCVATKSTHFTLVISAKAQSSRDRLRLRVSEGGVFARLRLEWSGGVSVDESKNGTRKRRLGWIKQQKRDTTELGGWVTNGQRQTKIDDQKKLLSLSARSLLLRKMVNWGISAKTFGTFRRKTKTAASRPDEWPRR